MAEIFTVETRGIGKPDYSRTVSSGIQRAGLAVKFNQALHIGGLVCTNAPSMFPWVRGPLAVGETAWAIDFETGLAAFSVQAGYGAAALDFDVSAREDTEVILYLDGQLWR